MPQPRPVTSIRAASRAVLRVGGTIAASVERYTGGDPFAEVVTEDGGLLPYAKKHIGDLRFADLEAQVAMDAHPVLLRWIRDAWFGNPNRDRVSLDTMDAGGAQSIELANARIRQVVLPALDTGSREKRLLTLRIAPRGVRRNPRPAPPVLDRTERDCLAHNFSVTLEGLDCSGVISVDSLAVETHFKEERGGRSSLLVFPDIHLHVDAERADPFREWFEDFVIAGHNDDDRERDGSIAYLDPMLGDPLAVLQLRHVGIYRVADEPASGSVRVDLYCERMELGSGAPSGDTDQVPPVKV